MFIVVDKHSKIFAININSQHASIINKTSVESDFAPDAQFAVAVYAKSTNTIRCV